MRRIVLRAIFSFYSRKACEDGVDGGKGGAVCQLQRFGSALNANLHMHAIVIDGVYTAPEPYSAPTFHSARRITDAEVASLLFTVRSRVLRLCHHRGLLTETQELAPADDTSEQGLLPLLYAASIVWWRYDRRLGSWSTFRRRTARGWWCSGPARSGTHGFRGRRLVESSAPRGAAVLRKLAEIARAPYRRALRGAPPHSTVLANAFGRSSGLQAEDENTDADHADREDHIADHSKPTQVLEQLLLHELG